MHDVERVMNTQSLLQAPRTEKPHHTPDRRRTVTFPPPLQQQLTVSQDSRSIIQERRWSC
jgi:hypothetical protein